MGGSNLPLINFGLIQFSAIPGMKPLGCPSQFLLWQPREVKNNFQEKELSHKCSTLGRLSDFVATAATVFQLPHFWRTEGRKLLHLCVTKNFESIARHDLI